MKTEFLIDQDNEVTVSSDEFGITLGTWDGCESSAALLDPDTARRVAAELIRHAQTFDPSAAADDSSGSRAELAEESKATADYVPHNID